MKKYFSLIGAIALAGLMHSCKKNNPTALSGAQQDQSNSLVSVQPKRPQLVSYKTGKGTATMLQFESWQDFDATAIYLQAQVDAAEADFNKRHANLTDDELNKVAEETGFDKQQPLIDMEERYGFSNAYRKTHNGLKEEWLNHAELDMAKNPSLKTLFYGAEQSLINDRQQVMVNDTIYQCTDTGYFFIAKDYSANLSLIESGTFGNFGQPSQTMGFFGWLGNLLTGASNSGNSSLSGIDCATWKKVENYDEQTSPGKRLIYYTGIRSFSFYCKSLAGVESYYKKGNKWKGYKTRITVYMQAALRDVYCGDVGPNVTKWEDKKSDDLQAHKTSWGGGEGNTAYRAKNGLSIYGSYTYYGIDKWAVLSW